MLQSSAVRDRRFADLLSQTDCFGPAELTALMSDHGAEGIASEDAICMHGNYWFTTACLQFYPCSRRMRIAYDTPCRASFSEIRLE